LGGLRFFFKKNPQAKPAQNIPIYKSRMMICLNFKP
jgi:hypothetical protein